MTGTVHAPSFNAGVACVRDLLRLLGERVIRADLSERQKKLVLALIDETVAGSVDLRMASAKPDDPGKPEPDGAPVGPAGGGSAGGGAVLATAIEDAA